MNKIALICTVFFLLYTNTAKSQKEANDQVIMKIENENVYLSEFLDQFNLTKDQIKSMDKVIIDDYLDLFLIFKLKIKESHQLGFDTTQYFLSEFTNYRNKAMSQFLYDKETHNTILKELYNRHFEVVQTNLIFVKLEKCATPKDTLAAYKKALLIREEIRKGANFWDMAEKVSDDSTARNHISPYYGTPEEGNKGDLGYQSVFTLHKSLEDFIYTSKEGTLSMPIRTELGYHIILTGKKIPFYGRAIIDHLWVYINSPADSLKAKDKIFEAAKLLDSGANFKEVSIQISDDKNASKSGGRLSSMGIQDMIPEYAEVISTLNAGQISKPFLTKFGWHIVRIEKKDTVPSLDDYYGMLEHRMQSFKRNTPSLEKFVETQKKIRNFQEAKPKELQSALVDIANIINDTASQWKTPDNPTSFSKPIFSMNNHWYKQSDFLNFIKTQKKEIPICDINRVVNDLYGKWINHITYELADSLLEFEIPELRKTIKSFHDGLLVYNFNEQEIWEKAVIDTVGFLVYYDHIKNNHYSLDDIDANPYMWDERAEIIKWNFNTSSCFDLNKCKKEISKAFQKNINDSILLKTLNKTKKKNCKNDPSASISFEKEILPKNKVCEWNKGSICDISNGDVQSYAIVKNLLSPTLKDLNEAKGYYINDYQLYLENQIKKNLLKKYKHVIYPEVFK